MPTESRKGLRVADADPAERLPECGIEATARHGVAAVQVHMSAEMAERLARRETDRLKELNPERTDLPAESVGSAVLNVLGPYASGSRI